MSDNEMDDDVGDDPDKRAICRIITFIQTNTQSAGDVPVRNFSEGQ